MKVLSIVCVCTIILMAFFVCILIFRWTKDENEGVIITIIPPKINKAPSDDRKDDQQFGVVKKESRCPIDRQEQWCPMCRLMRKKNDEYETQEVE